MYDSSSVPAFEVVVIIREGGRDGIERSQGFSGPSAIEGARYALSHYATHALLPGGMSVGPTMSVTDILSPEKNGLRVAEVRRIALQARGCALYVAREPLTDTNYTLGVGV